MLRPQGPRQRPPTLKLFKKRRVKAGQMPLTEKSLSLQRRLVALLYVEVKYSMSIL
jgi:hypothetical protein